MYDSAVPRDGRNIPETPYEEYKEKIKIDTRKLHDLAEDKERVLLGLKDKVVSKTITKLEIASIATIKSEMEQSIRNSGYLRDYLEMKSDSFRIFLGDTKDAEGKWDEVVDSSSEEEGGG